MDNVARGVATKLEAIFGDRVRTDQLEKLAYAHDMGVMPSGVRGTIQAVPHAVVQPVSTDEVIKLVEAAKEARLPLVPRGSASAGYGGAVPARGGIVVDFVRMNRVLAVNPELLTVKVEPGVIFQRLEEELNKEGLGLRLYPTSSPSATVGGWVAQGGTGLGSFAYGAIAQNVVSLDVVTPAGQLKHVAGKELDLYCSMEGTTGLIVAVELAVRRQAEDYPLAVAFPSAEALFGAVKALAEADWGMWNISLATPQFVDLQAKVHKGAVLPPGKFILTCVAPVSEKAKAGAAVARAAKKHGGEVLPAELAAAEWAERFYPMRLKRLGPSIIPAEVLLPADQAAAFLADVQKRFGDAYAFEGTMADRDHVTLLGFMLGDERRLTFALAFTSSLVVVELAREHGGRVFSTGMYFSDHAGEVLGQERLAAVWDLIRREDPQRLFNPGKVIPGSLDPKSPTKLLRAAMKAAEVGKSVMSRLGQVLAQGEVAEDGRKLPAEIAREAFVCAQCGYCRPGCTVFAASPWESNSPRGKYFLLSEYLKGRLALDEQVADRLFTCTTCKKCDTVCQTGIPIAGNWLSLRPALTGRKLENTGLDFVRENVLTKGNFWGAPNSARTTWYPAGVPNREKAKVAYWPGCWASLVMPNMPQNLVRILDKAGVDFTYLGEKETCCGLYFAVGGYQEDFARQVRRNIEEFARRGVETLLLSCPGCYATFSEMYHEAAHQLGLEWNVRVVHATVFMDELIRQGRLKPTEKLDLKATYHDSCHLGRWNSIYDEPRRVIEATGAQLVEMEHHHENALCCGLVCAFNSFGVVADAGVKRVSEALATKADVLVTACAGCGAQFTATAAGMKAGIKVRDISDLVCESLGLPVMETGENIGRFMQAAVEALKDSRVVKREDKARTA